jgi:hypothetical protein
MSGGLTAIIGLPITRAPRRFIVEHGHIRRVVRYDAMCQAIAAAYEVDEVKEIRDQARAIEIYAR